MIQLVSDSEAKERGMNICEHILQEDVFGA
jgi:hypothetical protein